MPKQKDDKPIVLHPMTFEDALKRMLKTPPVIRLSPRNGGQGADIIKTDIVGPLRHKECSSETDSHSA
jgi:hypothetical protein